MAKTAEEAEAEIAHLNQTYGQVSLCAGAHNFAPVRSVYGWQDQVLERTEGSRLPPHANRTRNSDR